MIGGSHMPPPFDAIIRSLDGFLELDFFNLFHISCMLRQSSYLHVLVVTSIAPILLIFVSFFSLVLIARRPSIGKKTPGEAFSRERLKRDWFPIKICKWSNIIAIWTWPSCVKVYSQTFICLPFDDGNGDIQRFMAADLSINCDSAEYTSVATAAIGAVIFVAPFAVLSSFVCVYSVRGIVETRVKRECSPLIDFFIARWKPHMWHFAWVEILRRVIVTSGLLIMPDVSSQCLFSIVANLAFSIWFRETNPYWDDATSQLQNIANWAIVASTFAMLCMDTHIPESSPTFMVCMKILLGALYLAMFVLALSPKMIEKCLLWHTSDDIHVPRTRSSFMRMMTTVSPAEDEEDEENEEGTSTRGDHRDVEKAMRSPGDSESGAMVHSSGGKPLLPPLESGVETPATKATKVAAIDERVGDEMGSDGTGAEQEKPLKKPPGGRPTVKRRTSRLGRMMSGVHDNITPAEGAKPHIIPKHESAEVYFERLLKEQTQATGRGAQLPPLK
mmetsp:Transcript_50076/g.141462  ORF Transcript_50076/g.141462 Transcript_50076/m.141462 type:complete len:502 (+) Transcript_50076:410-1915(+)